MTAAPRPRGPAAAWSSSPRSTTPTDRCGSTRWSPCTPTSEGRRRSGRRPGVVRRHRDPGGARPRVRSVAQRNTVARMDAITTPPAPVNEPNLTYAPGTPERGALQAELDRLERRQHSLRAYVNGRRRNGGGAEIKVVQPHDHQHVLGVMKNSTTTRRRGGGQGGARRGADVARDALRRQVRDHPQGRRPAGRSVAADGSTPRRCSASRRRRSRPRSTRPAS